MLVSIFSFPLSAEAHASRRTNANDERLETKEKAAATTQHGTGDLGIGPAIVFSVSAYAGVPT
jgi:hypothetical protein